MAPQKTPTTVPTAQPTTLSYIEFADLRLQVGTPATPFLVCSRAMARSSCVFRTMLFGGFAESKPDTGEWVVSLPDDDARGFVVLLHIIHGQVDKVPVDMVAGRENFPHYATADRAVRDASTFLYEVVRMADKYCVLHLLRPWINRWLKPWREDDVYMKLFSGEVLWAAWMVGDETVVRNELGKATFSARYRGMAYKGRAWVKDHHGREHRLGAMPDGPLALIDWEGLGEVIVNARDSHIEHLADIIATLHSSADFPLRSHPGVSEEDEYFFRMLLEEKVTVACESRNVRPAICLWEDDSLKAYKHTVRKLLTIIQRVAGLLNRDARRLSGPRSNLLLEGASDVYGRTRDVRSGRRDRVPLTIDHQSYLRRRRELMGVELTEPWMDKLH